jgi:hypothetical protein
VKTTSIRLKTILFLTSLISGCASLPPFPEVNQCGYSVKFNKFRCCDTETKKCFNLKREDPSMEAAQCLSADDYKKSEEWVQSVVDIANRRCK